MKTIKEYISTPEGVTQMFNKVNEVLDDFNFNSIANVMEKLNWRWACTHEEAEKYNDEGCDVAWGSGLMGMCEYIPKEKQLIAEARRIIMECITGIPENETTWSVSTGGFKARVFISTDEERREYWGEPADVDDFEHSVDIELYFILEESRSF